MSDPTRPRPTNPAADAGSRATLRPPHSGDGGDLKFEALVPRLKSPVSVPLGRLESTIFMRIDGRRTVLDIAQEVGLAPYEVLRILERLMELVPDLRLVGGEAGNNNVVELSVDDLWEESPAPNERTGEHHAVPDGPKEE